MSRSGYRDDLDDPLEWGAWRGRVASATRGKRGQKLLLELLIALSKLPEARLIGGTLEVSKANDEELAAMYAEFRNNPASRAIYLSTRVAPRSPDYREGDVCALGALVKSKGMPTAIPDFAGYDVGNILAERLDVAEPLIREIQYMNDEVFSGPSNLRWQRMAAWVAQQIKWTPETRAYFEANRGPLLGI